MPKLKTHRGVHKRFRKTGTGRIVRQKAGRRHLLSKKSRGVKRRMKQNGQVSASDQAAIRRLLPYG